MKNKRFFVLFLTLMGLVLNAEKLKLITVLYNETHPQRLQEYKTCLDCNLMHPSIDAIHVIYDTSKDNNSCRLLEYIRSQKITISYFNGRPSFAYCFSKANELFPENTVILSNADIYFNDTLKILEEYDLTCKFLAITRKNVQYGGSLHSFPGVYRGKAEPSQDVWIFKTPIRVVPREDIRLGMLHCEGEIAYAAYTTGLEVINPYFSIDCCHLHLSHIRHWEDRPYPNKPIYITQLTELPRVKK